MHWWMKFDSVPVVQTERLDGWMGVLYILLFELYLPELGDRVIWYMTEWTATSPGCWVSALVMSLTLKSLGELVDAG